MAIYEDLYPPIVDGTKLIEEVHPFNEGRVVIISEEVGNTSGHTLPQGARDTNMHSAAAKRAIEEAVVIDRAAGKAR